MAMGCTAECYAKNLGQQGLCLYNFFMRDRRFGFRVPYDVLLTSYVADRPVRGLGADLSDTGVALSTITMLAPPVGTVVGLEFCLPGVPDSIWAAGTVCYRRKADSKTNIATELGLRFVAMATAHARLLRDYCIETRRDHLAGLLAKIRA
jgi:c-di-GMP-binding flagellar brake protein YcgR